MDELEETRASCRRRPFGFMSFSSMYSMIACIGGLIISVLSTKLYFLHQMDGLEESLH